MDDVIADVTSGVHRSATAVKKKKRGKGREAGCGDDAGLVLGWQWAGSGWCWAAAFLIFFNKSFLFSFLWF